MTKDELKTATAIAKNSADLSDVDIAGFDGYGLTGFQPLNCTIRQVAKVMRWECLQFNGEFDAAAINEFAGLARRRFMIIG